MTAQHDALGLVETEGDSHDHDMVKANGQPRKLPHRYPQTLVDKSAELYEQHMGRMIDAIAEVLAE